MSLRDEVIRLVEHLPEQRLVAVEAFVREVGEQERAWANLAADRSAEVDAWHRAAIREAIDEANRPDVELIPHDQVVAWLRSWGTDNELPPPAGRGG